MGTDIELYLFAHNDDEFFISPFLKNNSNSKLIIYITYGSNYGTPGKIRIEETRSALKYLNCNNYELITLGKDLDVFDGNSYKNTNDLYSEILKRVQHLNIIKIIFPTWEGGHHDHDCCHLIGAALTTALEIKDSYEFSLYNGLNLPGPFFRAMYPITHNKSLLKKIKLTLKEALEFLFLCKFYKSQRVTFIGLLPAIAFQVLLKLHYNILVYHNRNYLLPPHSNSLFYEKRFKVKFEVFLLENKSFIETNLPLSTEQSPISSMALS